MTINIVRGLSQLKLLNNKIDKAIKNGIFVEERRKGSDKILNKYTDEEFHKNVKANYQSINDLIKQREKIKAAIVISNATTKLKINGTEMTVAEAIERKSSIKYEKALLKKLKERKTNIQFSIENANDLVESKLERLIETSFSNDNKSKNIKAEIENMSRSYRECNEHILIDPLNIEEVIKNLEEKIDQFESEVDFALTESNTVTQIEIEE